MIEAPTLRLIMPKAPQLLDAYAPLLNSAMVEGSIDTVTRAAAFLAQLAHESYELKYMEEEASGTAYEGRIDLGNTQRGDGPRYKGRGPIQLTGRANYRAAGQALGLDLETTPSIASDPSVGFRVAVWFWTKKNINRLADACDFIGVTRAINGGTNGLAQRQAYYVRALEVLGRFVKIA